MNSVVQRIVWSKNTIDGRNKQLIETLQLMCIPKWYLKWIHTKQHEHNSHRRIELRHFFVTDCVTAQIFGPKWDQVLDQTECKQSSLSRGCSSAINTAPATLSNATPTTAEETLPSAAHCWQQQGWVRIKIRTGNRKIAFEVGGSVGTSGRRRHYGNRGR